MIGNGTKAELRDCKLSGPIVKAKGRAKKQYTVPAIGLRVNHVGTDVQVFGCHAYMIVYGFCVQEEAVGAFTRCSADEAAVTYHYAAAALIAYDGAASFHECSSVDSPWRFYTESDTSSEVFSVTAKNRKLYACGISFSGHCKGTMEDCVVESKIGLHVDAATNFAIGPIGVAVSGQVRVTMSRCTITNGQHGLHVQNNGHAKAVECEFSAADRNSVSVFAQSAAVLDSCTFKENTECSARAMTGSVTAVKCHSERCMGIAYSCSGPGSSLGLQKCLSDRDCGAVLVDQSSATEGTAASQFKASKNTHLPCPKVFWSEVLARRCRATEFTLCGEVSGTMKNCSASECTRHGVHYMAGQVEGQNLNILDTGCEKDEMSRLQLEGGCAHGGPVLTAEKRECRGNDVGFRVLAKVAKLHLKDCQSVDNKKAAYECPKKCVLRLENCTPAKFKYVYSS